MPSLIRSRTMDFICSRLLFEARKPRAFVPVPFPFAGGAVLLPLSCVECAAMMGFDALPLVFIHHHPSQNEMLHSRSIRFFVVTVGLLYWTSSYLNRGSSGESPRFNDIKTPKLVASEFCWAGYLLRDSRKLSGLACEGASASFRNKP